MELALRIVLRGTVERLEHLVACRPRQVGLHGRERELRVRIRRERSIHALLHVPADLRAELSRFVRQAHDAPREARVIARRCVREPRSAALLSDDGVGRNAAHVLAHALQLLRILAKHGRVDREFVRRRPTEGRLQLVAHRPLATALDILAQLRLRRAQVLGAALQRTALLGEEPPHLERRLARAVAQHEQALRLTELRDVVEEHRGARVVGAERVEPDPRIEQAAEHVGPDLVAGRELGIERAEHRRELARMRGREIEQFADRPGLERGRAPEPADQRTDLGGLGARQEPRECLA